MKENNSIEKLIPLVKSIAGKYSGYGVPFEDLLQEGLIGIMDAEKRYKSGSGAKFSTYAVFWIKKKIIECLNREKSETAFNIEECEPDIPEKAQVTEESVKIDSRKLDEREIKVMDLLINERRTLNEIAGIMGLRRETVRQIKQKAARKLKLTAS